MSLIGKLKKHELIHPPKFLENNMLYLTTMGSQAYGVSTDNSDLDLYGFCMPPLETLFPTSYGGEIEGFTKKANRFEQWSQHSIKSPDSDTVYDFTVYNIAKYFRLTADANPNMVDSIFTPQHCVTFNTEIGQMVRDNRKMFLSKKVMHTFRGYAYQQQHKMRNGPNKEKITKLSAFLQNKGITLNSDNIALIREELARRKGCQQEKTNMPEKSTES